MLNIIKIKSEQKFIHDLSNRLEVLLNKYSCVLWVISGGSNIPLEVTIMNNINNDKSSNLEIILCDERFGEMNHKDSNYNQLKSEGFNPKNAHFENLLTERDPLRATKDYSDIFKAQIQKSKYIIAELGIGQDGHIAGILPNSSATSSKELTHYYKGPDYDRMTLTFLALEKINEVYLYTNGEQKKMVINKLIKEKNKLESFPSQILYNINKVSIYNNK